MNHIKLPNFITVIAFMAAVVFLSHTLGVSLEETIFGLFVSIFYGLLLIGYILRFVLIFLGVFGLYRILLERISQQTAV